jgi:two-component system chemotaxis sensor kinase CheA
MKIDLSQFRDTFLQESAEHIANIESGLLQLKISTDDETLHSIFRAAHSIKGGAGAFGFTDVVKFTHVLENLFDRMREHQIEVTSPLVSLLLRANDVLKALIGSHDGSVPPGTAEIQSALEAAYREASDSQTSLPSKSADGAPPPAAAGESEYTVTFSPAPEIFGVGSDPLLLLRNLSTLGRVISVVVDTQQLPSLQALIPETSYLNWTVTLETIANRNELDEIFEFVLDCAVVKITGKAPPPQAQAAGVPSAKAEQTVQRTPGKTGAPRGESASVRVPTEKIDKLIDLVGEMVIAHSITARLVENFEPQSLLLLQESVVSLERHIRELHERTMSVRMLPIGSLFSRFQRLIHDLANDTGKKLRLVVEGDDTEVDRSVLELLSDPLTHVLRNSADHGIEMPDVRTAAGKVAEGTILLRASHQAGNILLEIADDGAGLNLPRIREKAIAKELIPADAVLTDDQIRLLIFEPGFSTKEQVTNLSGRGVGMDVVKRNITTLNGTIQVDSKSGSGTHIRIQLPLTLAIMEGLIVRVESHNFVIPITSIVETVCLEPKEIHSIAAQGEVALVRGEAIPLIRLNRIFGLTQLEDAGSTPIEADVRNNRHLLVVVEYNDQRAALEVDELLGQQQIVVKSLERNFERLEGALGATILGDGRAALILDAQAIIQRRNKGGSSSQRAGKPRLSLVA